MMFDIHNPTKRTRIIYDGHGRQLTVKPGETIIDHQLTPHIVTMLHARKNDLVLTSKNEALAPDPVDEEEVIRLAEAEQTKPPMIVVGMFGIGDNIHQRAIVRELMQTHDVWLQTCHVSLYWDLIEQGLKVCLRPTHLRAQAKTIARERAGFRADGPKRAIKRGIAYHKSDIDRLGSLIEAQFGSVGLKPPSKPDFSLPIKPEWRAAARNFIDEWKPARPLLIYRPVIVRREWDSSSRNPDLGAYAAIFASIREQFFVVSIADLEPGKEWIIGEPVSADIELHEGELDFGTMAGLFAEANMVFSPAGFAPVLAQAVGTPGIIVYGGRESYRTTERAGAHLAPTLGIDPIHPCDCHSHHHNCRKEIDLPKALALTKEFVAATLSKPSSTLLFATTYIDTPERSQLLGWWRELADRSSCDQLIVDTCSPLSITGFEPYAQQRGKRQIMVYPDNIGHLGRHGHDGWGRAFCFGLQAAIDNDYEFVIHVEGDVLFRPSIDELIERMRRDNIKAASVPVTGTKYPEHGWVETGVIAFNVEWLKAAKFIERYNWRDTRKVYPKTPEFVVRDLIGSDLVEMPWRGQRNDLDEITPNTVLERAPDFITHCTDVAVYASFMGSLTRVPDEVPPLKLNFGGCANQLNGSWQNSDPDISKPLPFASNQAQFILAEHIVKHVDYHAAIEFLKECYRVLVPGGVLRIAVPSIEQVMECGSEDYFRFTTTWQPKPTARGAMHALLYAHGAKTAWTASLLRATLFYAGFDEVVSCRPGESRFSELRGVEGHHKIIGHAFNDIETIICEAGKPLAAEVPVSVVKVAVVVAGADCWRDDLEMTMALLERENATPTFFYVNDQIAHFDGLGIAVTLHPDKLDRWLVERQHKGFPAPTEVWAHRAGKNITNNTRDWAGSSGLLAVKAAREKGFERIICCGVPMTAEAGHFVRKQRWHSFNAFRKGWVTNKGQLAPYVRSWSGWTAELLGKPDEAFLR